ncbi:MAG: hypothetical protein BroJett025_03460 [Patescibacteria group bacterium]|nr:MAG: hypothetical protein BroJett025_03460 [Patescibacteria group bacterium]
MLNTKKLLYILPDLAYIAELLPAKKEYTFTIQSFRQINGEFIDENELIPTSIEKLFSKLEKEEYHLILPDFLFTNTIVTVEGTSETKVLDYVTKVLLPDLQLSKDTHEIETTVLTSFKGNSKVQISAIEKSVLAPIRGAAKKSETTIAAVSPLTWSVKAIISLEPSISVLQMGSQLYTALHYIGVDQTNNFPMDDYDAIAETVKTLKGSEPSIQSVYLASSSLVEEDIKEKLSGTLPIQQVVSFKEDDSKMPSYIKHIIESTMRTLSIPDFPVPQFKVGKATEEDMLSLTKEPEKKVEDTEEEDEVEETSLPVPTKVEPTTEPEDNETQSSSKTIEPAKIDLPAPIAPAATMAAKDTGSLSMTEEQKKELEKVEPIESLDTDTNTVETEPAKESETDVELPSIPEIDTTTKADEALEKKPATLDKTPAEEPKKESSDDEIDLSQFASKDTDEGNGLAVDTEIKGTPLPEKNLDKTQKKVIKNSSGVNNMLKMVFITVAVFFITIAIGVGVGLGLLKMSENKTEETTPAVVTETPAPTPTPTPTPEVVEIKKDELSILIVNATTKAGYAGTIKKLLTDAEFTDVTAGNAKGEYETGADETNLLLMKAENPELQKLLEETTELTFEYSSEIDTEDTADKYDAVIVLTQLVD